MFNKLKKLRLMKADEILYRFRERYRREVDRVKFHSHIGVNSDKEFESLLQNYGLSLKNYLQYGPASRFYTSTQNRDSMIDLVEQRFPEWLERTLADAEYISEHRINLLGYPDIALGDEINWNRDPVTGHVWPRHYWADYDLVHSSPVDPKIILELNRQQHLPRLAKAFFLTGNERYARVAVAQMESWINQNPRWSGINWHSSLDIAIRAISWMWTLFLLLPSKCLDEQSARRICKSLVAQLDHVYRYPSVYSSPNTHLIGEAAALFMGGLLFSDLPRAEKWRQFGSIVLMNEMQRQISEEGIYEELSSYYHCYATDFYLQTLTLAKLNRFPFPDWMWNRLAQMIDAVMHFTRPDGSMPLLGDDDGGRVVQLSRADYSCFRDGLSSGAVLFGRPDFKHQAREFCEESLWLLGYDSWPVFNSLDAQAPVQLSRSYAQDGYFIQRSGWEEQDSHLVFDCGGLGMMSGGHGHADALSLTLFNGGRELLIDPGTSVYNCAPDWREFFRSTRAHNTVVVDRASQSEASDTFAWKKKGNARVLKQIARTEIEYVDGEHDGYTGLQEQVVHRRRVVYIRPNYWIVLDELSGRGEHEYELLYHFAPGAKLMIFGEEGRGEVDCRARIGDTGLQMFLYGSGPLQAEAICGQTDPIQGWSSHRYGERRPSPVLRTTLCGFAPAAIMSFLAPGEKPIRSRRFETGSRNAIAAAVRDGDYDDIAVMSLDGAEMRMMDCLMRGEFFWMRTENGALKQVVAVNVQLFTHAGEVVFESREPSPYIVAHFWENGMVIERGEHEGKVYVRDLRDRQFQSN